MFKVITENYKGYTIKISCDWYKPGSSPCFMVSKEGILVRCHYGHTTTVGARAAAVAIAEAAIVQETKNAQKFVDKIEEV